MNRAGGPMNLPQLPSRCWRCRLAGVAAAVALMTASPGSVADSPATSSAPAASGSLYKVGRGPWSVRVVDESWRDAARRRDVPVRLYLPRRSAAFTAGESMAATQPAAKSRFPVIIFSHGLWASRTTYGYFGQH